jgi:hypothetical protein
VKNYQPKELTMKKPFKLFAALSITMTLAMPLSSFAIGAIAVDDEEGETDPGFGYVTGMDSESAAKAGALKECSSQGNKNCKVAVWFKQCGAYAASKKYSGIGYGSSKRVAEAKALDECGNSACKIKVSECEE